MILFLSADHGPNVSGAYTTITAACAGIPLSQAVASGLTMIGPRFGGAVEGAARAFSEGVEKNMEPQQFVDYWTDVKKEKIMGIGHLKYTKNNPDPRVAKMVEELRKMKMNTPVLDFALKVQDVTTRKADTLILNWDGAIGCVLYDLGFSIPTMNAFFVLSRTIGFIGHYLDQVRRGSGLLRLPYTEVAYVGPQYVEPKEIDKRLNELEKTEEAGPAQKKGAGKAAKKN
jgi:ATP-citrate lyase alpha-subunit